MVIDTSAVLAAIANEADAGIYRTAISTAPLLLISSVTLLETRIVLYSQLGPDAVRTFDQLVHRAGIEIVPFDLNLSLVAFVAFHRYGKGRGSPAQLNIVDCAAYALASERKLPLLFKGNGFSATDIQPAIIPDGEQIVPILQPRPIDI